VPRDLEAILVSVVLKGHRVVWDLKGKKDPRVIQDLRVQKEMMDLKVIRVP